jgi:hypothetical protein
MLHLCKYIVNKNNVYTCEFVLFRVRILSEKRSGTKRDK